MTVVLTHDATVALTGLWLAGAVAGAPFSLSWQRDDEWSDTGRTALDPSALLCAAMWPVVPFSLAVGVPAILALVGVCWLLSKARKWWVTDWGAA